MVVVEMGFDADPHVETVQEVAVATAPIDSPIGVIEPGLVAARRFHWRALVDGVPVVTATVNWLMGEQHLDPAWTFGPEGQRFECAIDAEPPVSVVVHGRHPPVVGEHPEIGLTAPAMHCVNAIPYVCAAPAGVRTYLDLPLMAGRAS